MALRHVMRQLASSQPPGLCIRTFRSATGFRSAASSCERTRVTNCLLQSSPEGSNPRTWAAERALHPGPTWSQVHRTKPIHPTVAGTGLHFMSRIAQLHYRPEETGSGPSGPTPASVTAGQDVAAAESEAGSAAAASATPSTSNVAATETSSPPEGGQEMQQESKQASSRSKVPDSSAASEGQQVWPGGGGVSVGDEVAEWWRGEADEDDEGEGGAMGDEGVSKEVQRMVSQLEGKSRTQQAFLIGQMLKVKPLADVFVGDRELLQHMNLETKLIDVNRVDKVTKGGRMTRYSALIVMGNKDGVVGFGKGKASEVAKARNKAILRALKSLQYCERYQNHTIFHEQVVKYGTTKLYLWPARSGTGMRANYTVGAILRLAGFKDVKSKVIGSHNPHNTVKATFKALGLIKTPEDMARIYGRTVIEKPILYK
ncbi:hypothetical protein CBR_g50476 [Chara braunii]|uniref:S5 DRBM domain-containing protein n=1 Tax=Chara braunii TaxID=69332 RepID=A0A388M6U0_CHABU|nr:hypothetical protein CBR_g50476 [Chara braunii]|eukprot:GBG90298.1 hypothetical protein CBR_g50476 [Chara braunii]